MYLRIGKRCFDLIICLIALPIFTLFFLIIALVVKLDSKGPILFKQKRIGKDKTQFNILKFRTMQITTPNNIPTHLLQNPNNYVTGAGRLLRKSSLDEIPQFINIIKGEMSIVGPRPALWNQYDLIDERDKYGANEVLPGLTGWAQVNGRDELPIIKKAALDGIYVSKISFWVDLKIIALTVLNVIKANGIVEGKQTETDTTIKEVAAVKEE